MEREREREREGECVEVIKGTDETKTSA